jgi:hypothetical protein
MFVAAVAMVCARGHTAAVGAELVLDKASKTSLLTVDYLVQPTLCSECNCRQRSLHERPTMTERAQLLGEQIESVRIHRLP